MKQSTVRHSSGSINTLHDSEYIYDLQLSARISGLNKTLD